jgi:biotin carboxyl carrier protein
VAALSRRLRIGPSAATRRPGDEPRVVDLDRLDPDQGLPGWRPGFFSRPGLFVGPVHPTLAGPLAVEVVVDGWRFELEVEDAVRADLRRRATREPDSAAASGPTEIRAIIPGRIAAVHVVAGDVVEAGQSLLVVEAMKMQNELRTSRSGTVERVAVGEGETIDNGDLLVVLR